LQQWAANIGAVALISDHFAVEATPASLCIDDFCAALPLHAHRPFRLGCHIGEMFYLTRLADWPRANGRNRFLFTGPPEAAWRRWFTGHAGGNRLTVRGSLRRGLDSPGGNRAMF
jgi:hypothetical protein